MIGSKLHKGIAILAATFAIASCGDATGSSRTEIGRVTVQSADGSITYLDVQTDCGLFFCPIDIKLDPQVGVPLDLLISVYDTNRDPVTEQVRVGSLSTNVSWTAGVQQGNALHGTLRCITAGQFQGVVELRSHGHTISSLNAITGFCHD